MNKDTQQAIDELNMIIKQLKEDHLSINEVRQLLHHTSILVRVNALEALSRRSHQTPELIDDLVRAALDPDNNTKLLGARVSHVAVACLFKVGTDKAQAEARHLIENWPEPDRSDLLWFLNSESVSINDDS